MKTLRIAVLLLPLIPIVAAAAEPRRGQGDRLPNILFIVSDDHGWGDLPANWDKKVCGFRSTIPSRCADRLGPACLPVNTRRKTACGVAPANSRSDRRDIAVSNVM